MAAARGVYGQRSWSNTQPREPVALPLTVHVPPSQISTERRPPSLTIHDTDQGVNAFAMQLLLFAAFLRRRSLACLVI